MCPLKQLCAPYHGSRGCKIKEPGPEVKLKQMPNDGEFPRKFCNYEYKFECKCNHFVTLFVLTLDELFSRPAPVLSAAPAAPVAPRQPSPAPAPPQTVTPPTTSPVAPMPSPAEQARMERERQRKREQERRRREAQVYKFTVTGGFAANFVNMVKKGKVRKNCLFRGGHPPTSM